MVWGTYFEKTASREQRLFYRHAMSVIENAAGVSAQARVAIELGCGAGVESADLVRRGWHVLAVDGDPAALDFTRTRVLGAERAASIEFLESSFEDLDKATDRLPRAALVCSFMSLPFCAAERFESAWTAMSDAVAPRGFLVLSLFGPDDDWAKSGKVWPVTLDSVRHRLLEDGYDVLHLTEARREGPSADGALKQWHVIEVIGRKTSH